MKNMKMILKLIILIVIIDKINQSIALKLPEKRKIIDSGLWALKWFEQNKNELISIKNNELKLKLYQELMASKKYQKIDQKTFDEIYKKVLYRKKTFILEKNLSKNFYLLRPGK
jgi:hypothetical protein